MLGGVDAAPEPVDEGEGVAVPGEERCFGEDLRAACEEGGGDFALDSAGGIWGGGDESGDVGFWGGRV